MLRVIATEKLRRPKRLRPRCGLQQLCCKSTGWQHSEPRPEHELFINHVESFYFDLCLARDFCVLVQKVYEVLYHFANSTGWCRWASQMPQISAFALSNRFSDIHTVARAYIRHLIFAVRTSDLAVCLS